MLTGINKILSSTKKTTNTMCLHMPSYEHAEAMILYIRFKLYKFVLSVDCRIII